MLSGSHLSLIVDEGEEVPVETLAVGEVEAVGRVLIDHQPAIRDQLRGSRAGQRERRGGIGVALDHERGHSERREFLAEVGLDG